MHLLVIPWGAGAVPEVVCDGSALPLIEDSNVNSDSVVHHRRAIARFLKVSITHSKGFPSCHLPQEGDPQHQQQQELDLENREGLQLLRDTVVTCWQDTVRALALLVLYSRPQVLTWEWNQSH